jgi:gliding motility-associated-like protein
VRKIVLLIAFCFSLCASATHNRAGEILYKRIEPFTTVVGGLTVQVYTYSFTIIKYTNDGANVADRCVDTLYFGDGAQAVAPRVLGPACNDCQGEGTCGVVILSQGGYIVKKNIYTITHTYAGPGNYLVHSFDPNRNEGVQNMLNSVSVPFYIESLLIIDPISGANSSPIFGNDPIDKACFKKCFYHNPGAYDPDGDSLSFELTYCRGTGGLIVPGYYYPPQQEPGTTYSINPFTGLLTWCSPQVVSQYNLAFIVKEWRKNTSNHYYLVGYVLRDMQVIVEACPNNDPPNLEVPKDTCVEAGTLINKVIKVTDPNPGNVVTVTGAGGAYAAPSPTASPFLISAITPYTFQFNWQTTCDHIRSQPYICVFKATDNQSPTPGVGFWNYNIRVVPPSVKNVTASPLGSTMKITWSLSACDPPNNPIIGYKVYRKNDCNGVTFDPCKTGVDPTLGYTYIGQSPSTSTLFIDNNGGNGLTVGQDYSYLIVALYTDGSLSFASSQVCAKLKRDVPILLNVDVLSTSASTGSVFLRWTRPLTTAGNLDTNVFAGPYTFNLQHRVGATGTFSNVHTTTANSILQLDTSYTNTGLNTVDTDHQYQIEFLASGTINVGTSQKATSEFLTGVPGDRKVNLSWAATTPWINDTFVVFRRDPGTIPFYTIAAVTSPNYIDNNNVVNRYTYCYKILSRGAYSDPTIFKPLLNKSQEICATAVDQTAPCTPSITVNASCLGGSVTVSWNNVALSCSDDVIKYILYKKKTIDEEFVKLDTIRGSGNITMIFPPENAGEQDELIQSCYAIQAVDSSANVSPRSPDYCVDNCPEFELPNIISLNGDGINDFFKAVKVRQIKEIDLYVFDRWGNNVFKTKDPYFQWNGKSAQSGLTVSDGTFFYICDVYEPRVTGIKKRSLKGYMQVVK